MAAGANNDLNEMPELSRVYAAGNRVRADDLRHDGAGIFCRAAGFAAGSQDQRPLCSGGGLGPAQDRPSPGGRLCCRPKSRVACRPRHFGQRQRKQSECAVYSRFYCKRPLGCGQQRKRHLSGGDYRDDDRRGLRRPKFFCSGRNRRLRDGHGAVAPKHGFRRQLHPVRSCHTNAAFVVEAAFAAAGTAAERHKE